MLTFKKPAVKSNRSKTFNIKSVYIMSQHKHILNYKPVNKTTKYKHIAAGIIY